MAFKGKKDKKKKKKGAKKSAADREWDHEGGVNFASDSGAAEGGEPQAKRQRRQTQDRDERLRRSRQKLHYKKEKSENLKKMRKGIRFSDVLSDGEDASSAVQEKPEVREHVQFTSEKSVFERLQGFVAKSTSSKPRSLIAASSGGASDSEEDEEEEQGSEDEEDEGDGSDHRDGASDEGEGGIQNLEDRFESFFRSAASADNDDAFDGYKSIGEWGPSHEIFADLNTSIVDDAQALVASECRTAGQIPGLHRMWKSRLDDKLDDFSSKFVPYLLSYADVFFDGCDETRIRDVESSLSVHISQHIIRARALMQKHNEKLRKLKEREKLEKAISTSNGKQIPKKKKESDANKKSSGDEDVADLVAAREALLEDDDEGDEEGESNMQDQGYTRPRILILCPFRSSARRIIEGMISFMGQNTSVTGHEKFLDEFGNPDGEVDDAASDDGSASGRRGDGGASVATRGGDGNANKPRDWRALFNDNIDDDFKIGIQVTPGQGKGSGVAKGANVKLFSDFFLSDIIVASPLGLRLVVNAKDSLTFDFLSSLEVVLLHQTDVMYMQNWDHVDFIVSKLNGTPKTNHDTDFMRVRSYFLEGRAAKHRQFLMTSNFNEPLIWSMFREQAQSLMGHIRFKKSWGEVGCLGGVATRVRQMFHLIPCPSIVDDEDTRFDFFKKNILGPMLRLDQKRTLIVTPSYLSFVRVRNELMKQEASAVYVSEYSRESEISRGRSRFYHGDRNIMLYSGRAHFFRRFLIRGARHIIFYSLPEYCQFYPELVNLLREHESGATEQISCTVLFTRFERMALERIVGEGRCEHMLSSGKSSYMFC